MMDCGIFDAIEQIYSLVNDQKMNQQSRHLEGIYLA